MPYSTGRRTSFGSAASTPLTNSLSGVGSRLSVPAARTSTRATFTSNFTSAGTAASGASPAGHYSSTYSTPSPGRPSGNNGGSRYSRFSSISATRDTPGSKAHASRYDSYYSTYRANNAGRRSSDIGTENRYTSPSASSTSGRPYYTVNSGVSTSRESSLSKSWPSPARTIVGGVNLSRYDPSVRSSSSTVAASIERRRRSPTVVGGSVPALPSSSNYLNIESRRGSAHSIDLSLNRTPSTSALHSQLYRRYLGSASGGAADGNFDAGRAESLYRPSTRYTSSGANRYLTSGGTTGTKTYGLYLDTTTLGSSSRRASAFSPSSSVRTSSMSRSPVHGRSPSPGTASKSLWNKHYTSLSSRWAEQTGATLNSTASGKNQYSYRPVTVRRMSSGTEVLSDCSVGANNNESSITYTRRGRRKDKAESDGYDSSSSSADEATERSAKATTSNGLTTKPSIRSKRTLASTAGNSINFSNRRSKTTNSNSSGINGAVNGSAGTGATGATTSLSSRRQEERQPSSSDNETAQDSLDARIKARRKRLQKSKTMLQEHKEDGWHYRRMLQIEESKQRQQTSAAATISYSRNAQLAPIKRDDEEATKSDTVAVNQPKSSPADVVSESKPAQQTTKTDVIKRSPRLTPSRSTLPSSSLDENASGFRVQKVYLQPLKVVWNNDSAAATQSDNGGKESIKRASEERHQRVQQLQNDEKSQRHRGSSVSPGRSTALNVGRKTSLDEDKRDSAVNYRRSPLHKLSPMPTRGISNEKTPPPPISQRQDFNYSEYVHSIAPKSINYENPTAALVEADQQQQLEDLPKSQGSKRQGDDKAARKEDKSKGDSQPKVNGSMGEQNTIPLRTKPVRSQPPSVVVVTPVSPSSTKRSVNNPSQPSISSTEPSKPLSQIAPSTSLNSIPTPFRRTSLSPSRKSEKRPSIGLSPSRSSEKLATRSPEYQRRQPPLQPPTDIVDDDERKRNTSEQQKNVARPNYEVVNGDHSLLKKKSMPDRSTPTVTIIPVVTAPAKIVPEKLTPVFTQTFNQPSTSEFANAPNSSHGVSLAAKRSNALENQDEDRTAASGDRSRSTPQKEIPTPTGGRVNSRSHEGTPANVATNGQHSAALVVAKVAEETLRLELKKHQCREALRKESLAELHRLPSIDQEMLQLLTLGEELNASRGSVNTATSQTSGTTSVDAASQQSTAKFAQSFRTAMPHKGARKDTSLPSSGPHQQRRRVADAGGNASYQGSRESLNSCTLTVAPKPLDPFQGSRDGSSESIASSFATAATDTNVMKNGKDSSSGRAQFLNSFPKPWSNKMSGKDKLSISAEPLPTLKESPSEVTSTAPPGQFHERNTSSLALATKKVDEMLRLAKLKHKQQQRREKIILLQSQVQQPQNRMVITKCELTKAEERKIPKMDASKELDKAYEAIRLDYAEAQETRQRHRRLSDQKQPNSNATSDNENVFMKPQLVTVFSTVRMPSPRRALSGDEAIRRRPHHQTVSTGRKLESNDRTRVRKESTRGQTLIEEPFIGTQYDRIKMDYTKRWLEGDLKSLAQETKPDLLQFGSTPKMDIDQCSIGSASAEVAAITNKERLKAMRAVPDLVPQNQLPQKPHLVKPAPVIPVKQPSSNNNIGKFANLAPPHAANFLGPRIGQPGSKSSSFAGGLPSLQTNGADWKHAQQKSQQYGYQWQQQRQAQPPTKLAPPVNLNSGAIKQAVEQLRSSAESLSHSDRSWTIPKKVCAQGHVRRHVDMFDRMSDNDSELSFRSADNVAYRSALYKPSRRLSLTDHMAHFVRRFESDEESSHGGGRGDNFHRRMHQPRQAQNYLHSDDEVRLAVLRHSNSNAPHFKRPLANAQNTPANGNGSTQSLPVTMPYHNQKFANGGLHPGFAPNTFQRGSPRFLNAPFGQNPVQVRSASQINNCSFDQHQTPQQYRKVVPPWLRGTSLAVPPKQQQFWSSNSTLTDAEAPGVARYHPNRGSKMTNSNANMEAVDNLIAELELHTDCSGSIISQRSTGTFPVDRYYYNNHYHQYSTPSDIEHSSSRSKLNAIPEQAEQQQQQQQQNPFEALHVAQRRLEEARRDLKHVGSNGIRGQFLAAGQESLSNGSFPRPAQERSASQIQASLVSQSTYANPRKGNHSNSSLPQSFDSGERRNLISGRQQQQNDLQTDVRYRQSRPAVSSRPASFAGPGGSMILSPPSNSFVPSGSADRIAAKRSLGNDDDDNYDNVYISSWRPEDSQKNKSAPSASTMPSRPLHSPGLIKIGSVVLGRGSPVGGQPVESKVEKQPQQMTRNPLKNFFQFFNKGNNSGKAANGDVTAGSHCSQAYEQLQQRSYHHQISPASSSQKAPSTFSLNLVRSAEPSSNGNHWGSGNMTGSVIGTSADFGNFHKSSSTNDAYAFKTSMTPQEMRQLDELLTSFHDSASATAAKELEKNRTNVKSRTTTAAIATAGATEQTNQIKSNDRSGNNNNNAHEQRSHSKFRLGLPSFWKRAS